MKSLSEIIYEIPSKRLLQKMRIMQENPAVVVLNDNKRQLDAGKRMKVIT